VSQKFEKTPQLRVGINRVVRKRLKFSSIWSCYKWGSEIWWRI